MRILHISTRLILGGSQENTVLSCEGQARLGHEVHLAFGPIYGPEGSLLERVQNFRTDDGRGITTHEIPHLIREISPLADRKGYRELRRLIRDLQPDVVHTHSSKAGILGRAAAWAELLPLPEGGGRGVGSIRAQARGGLTLSGLGSRNQPTPHPSLREGHRMAVIHTIHGPPFHDNLPWHTNRLYIAAERFAARRCHAIVGVADAMVRQFVERNIGRPMQFYTVYSGMDTAPFLYPAIGEDREQVRHRLHLAPGDFVIGTVARLAEHKGHDDVVEALADDLRTRPHWKLLWVGDGWWRERLVAKARGLGLSVAELDRAQERTGPHPPTPPLSPAYPPPRSSAQLLLTGLVPPERIPGLMRAMDALVHPSYREGLPRTVPQALLCGTCPIAYDTDGTPEVCRDMQTGRLVKTGDAAALREAVRWAAENPVARAALAVRGREECRERFSAERMVFELDRIYRRVLGRDDAAAEGEGLHLAGDAGQSPGP